MKAIQTENLTKFYGKRRGIENVSLTVEEGDFFGFIGPNGAGKSTTIRTLTGLLFPSSGSAEIFGKDIISEKMDILSDIGYLPSETFFYSGMKVRDILKFSAALRRKDCRKEAESLCERLALDPDCKINELSLGNRKKTGIVVALQHKPRLYILDEPTGGLDPLMQQEFYSILKERNQEGATVFLSSHILSEVSRYCVHAAVIREGNLLISDSVEKLGHTGIKRVVLQGTDGIPQISHMSNVEYQNGCVRFLYDGNQENLIRSLSALSFTDISITDPDFEEVFMHYYQKEENRT